MCKLENNCNCKCAIDVYGAFTITVLYKFTQTKIIKSYIKKAMLQMLLGYRNDIIKQVASNKSSLLLKIQKWITQTLQLFTEIIKIER